MNHIPLDLYNIIFVLIGGLEAHNIDGLQSQNEDYPKQGDQQFEEDIQEKADDKADDQYLDRDDDADDDADDGPDDDGDDDGELEDGDNAPNGAGM